MTTTLKNQNEIKEQPLPTPISIQHLEAALSGHPDQHFVSQLCNNFKFDVHIGFQGQRAPRFSRNLPTALANPDIVSSNLAREVLLGRTAVLLILPHLKIFRFFQLPSYQRKIRINFVQFSICRIQSQAQPT